MGMTEKYRPNRFDAMWQWPCPSLTVITREIERGRLETPALLRADYGEGKSTLARIIGRRASCLKPDPHPYEPCNDCDGCKSIEPYHRTFINDYRYFEIDCTAYTSDQLLDMILENTWGSLHKTAFKRWVVCIDEIGRRDIKYQQKLLKMIENLRPHILLCCGSADKLDRALRDRCVIRPLKPPTTDQCVNALRRIAEQENVEIRDAATTLLVTRLGCNPRRILKSFGTAMSLAPSRTIGIAEIELALEMSNDS